MITADEARAMFTIDNRVAALLKMCEDEINRVAGFKQECRIVFRKNRVNQEQVIAQVTEFLRASGFSASLTEHEIWVNDRSTDHKEVELLITWSHI